MIIDGYQFDGAYVDRLPFVGTTHGDDRRSAAAERVRAICCCDVNLGALQQPYALAPQTTPLLGPRFTLVREEFTRGERPSPSVVPVASRLHS